ncbi:conserved hypothetical protein [Symbiobacterium thermophilum IAM 14863]|uniref:Uncharacterized protein n=2 Tax=Symbiobacterium thermophilum TaxID=2734 RepID=Q67NQ3_SYMTH|nr:conserved hypothetical protein [Symbiobacterium thermophilum IAM 14863]
MRALWTLFRQDLRSRWRLGHGHPRRRVRTALLLAAVALLHLDALTGQGPAPGEAGDLPGILGLAAAYAALEALALLSVALVGLVRGGRTAALAGYVALPLIGLPAAALGHALASLSLRVLGRGLTHLLVRALQLAALGAALAGLDLSGGFGWWAGPGHALARGAVAVLASTPLLVALAARLTAFRAHEGAGGRRSAEGIVLRPVGFSALLRKEMRLIVRDPRVWGRLLAAPVAAGAIVLSIFRSQPLLSDPAWTATALGVFCAGMVGMMTDVFTHGEADRVPLLRLSPTPLSRLIAAKTLPALPLVLLTAAAGGVFLAAEGIPGAPLLIAAGALAGTACAWFNVEYRFRMFTTRSTVRSYAAAFLMVLALFAASAAVLGHVSFGPVVGVTNLVLAGLLFAGAFMLAGRPQW